MPLTKQQIIEIQEAAKFNYMKRLREQQELKQHEETVKVKIAESKVSVQKGK